ITTRMHVHTFYFYPKAFYQALQVTRLVNRNTKLGVDVSHRNLDITTRHNVWVQTDANGVAPTVLRTKMLKYTQVINIDTNAQLHSSFDFFKRNPVRCINNVFRCKAGFQSKLHFLNRDGIQTASQFLEKAKYVDITKSLASVVHLVFGTLKSFSKTFILRLHFGGVVHIKRSTILLAKVKSVYSRNLIISLSNLHFD